MHKGAPVALVVDDEVQIRRFLRAGLELEGIGVREASTGKEALRAATLRPADLVILDLGLPDMDGSEIVERLRSWSSVPIIVLSVRSQEEEKVRLLQLGADDYVVKPFGIRELLARVDAVLRRSPERPADVRRLAVPGGQVDLDRREVVFEDGGRCDLSAREVELLRYLAANAGRIVARDELLSRVWGVSPHSVETRTVDVHVGRLRDKMRDHDRRPPLLVTIRGKGYRLDLPGP
jgi:DNA-binding response OmpR family regulator